MGRLPWFAFRVTVILVPSAIGMVLLGLLKVFTVPVITIPVAGLGVTFIGWVAALCFVEGGAFVYVPLLPNGMEVAAGTEPPDFEVIIQPPPPF